VIQATNSQKSQCCWNQEGLGNTIILYKINIFSCTFRRFCITIAYYNGVLVVGCYNFLPNSGTTERMRRLHTIVANILIT